MADDRVVIVGAGLAGFRAAQSLRDAEFTGEVVLVGDEIHEPYDRPPLSKQLLAGDYTREECKLPGEADGVTWRLGVAAVGLDRAAREVELADGQKLGYDRLVIATGRRARPWPAPSPAGNVFTLRSFDDVDAFDGAVADDSKVVIIGAGFIGCEVAATLRKREIDVTVVDVSATPMPVLGAEVGERAVQLHEAQGVKFRLGEGVAQIHGDDAVTGVELNGGEVLPADVVLVSIGSLPNTEWLAGSDIALVDGVVQCDRTGTVLDGSGHPIEEIMAAGDVAAWPHPDAPGAVCIEHWSNARDMADVAAKNLFRPHAERDLIRSVPAFWSDQYHVKIKSAGFLRGADSLTLISEDPEKPSLVVEARRGDKVIGAITFNMNRAMIGYQRQLNADLA